MVSKKFTGRNGPSISRTPTSSATSGRWVVRRSSSAEKHAEAYRQLRSASMEQMCRILERVNQSQHWRGENGLPPQTMASMLDEARRQLEADRERFGGEVIPAHVYLVQQLSAQGGRQAAQMVRGFLHRLRQQCYRETRKG